MKLKEIIENYPDEQFCVADGFNKAILGFEPNTMKIVYSIEKCIKILQTDMTEEEAIEYFEFNVLCAHVGERTPIYVNTQI